jgi:hypothetical protein
MVSTRLTEFHSQYMTPPFHPLALACLTQVANVAGSMYLYRQPYSHLPPWLLGTYPLLAAPALMGFPITILSSGTPAYEFISNTEVEGQLDPESKINVYPSVSLLHHTPLQHKTYLAVHVDIALVIKLHVVEIDPIPRLLVNRNIRAIGIIRSRSEPGSNRRMRNQVLPTGQLSSKLELESDQPCLAATSVHGLHVFPVDIDSIEVVLLDPSCEPLGTVGRVDVVTDGRVGRAECGNHQGDTGGVVIVQDLVVSFYPFY